MSLELAPSFDLVVAAEATLALHSKTFRLASLFLSRRARQESAVLYAFCRMADDTVDEAKSEEEARLELERIRHMLLEQSSASPLVGAFLDLAELRQFGTKPALELLRGMEGDLDVVRVKDRHELELYCYRAAGTVGEMMTGVLGVRDPVAKGPAIALGQAMQLTNICRDILEDAGRDRVYLPEDLLASVGLGGLEIVRALCAGSLTPSERKALLLVVTKLLGRADELYRFARRGYRFLPFRARVAIAIAARLYQGIGHRILAGEDPTRGRVVVPRWQKFKLIFWGLSDAFRSLVEGTVDVRIDAEETATAWAETRR